MEDVIKRRKSTLVDPIPSNEDDRDDSRATDPDTIPSTQSRLFQEGQIPPKKLTPSLEDDRENSRSTDPVTVPSTQSGAFQEGQIHPQDPAPAQRQVQVQTLQTGRNLSTWPTVTTLKSVNSDPPKPELRQVMTDEEVMPGVKDEENKREIDLSLTLEHRGTDEKPKQCDLKSPSPELGEGETDEHIPELREVMIDEQVMPGSRDRQGIDLNLSVGQPEQGMKLGGRDEKRKECDSNPPKPEVGQVMTDEQVIPAGREKKRKECDSNPPKPEVGQVMTDEQVMPGGRDKKRNECDSNPPKPEVGQVMTDEQVIPGGRDSRETELN